jgi:predicted N-acetyltransferase YhbS
MTEASNALKQPYMNGVSKDIHVRVAEPADAAKITVLINSAFRPAEMFFVEGERIRPKEVLDSFDTGKFLLAEDENGVVGCVYVEPRGERSYLGLLSVDPSRQQSGLGSLLMAAGEDYCRGLGSVWMDIKIVNLRKELPDFYRKRGYAESGTSSFPVGVVTKEPCFFIDMSKSLAPAKDTA